MTRFFVRSTIVIFGLFTAGVVNAAGDPAKGKELFAVCAACHGQNGEGNKLLNAPANGGQDEWYVIRQLRNFRSGVRGSDPKDTYGAQMRPMAMQLADDQAVEDVAAYVANLPAPQVEANVEGNAEAGKNAFQPCVACHGANGEGNKSLNAPRLSNQHDWYIVRQLQNFKSGVRGTHAKDIYGQQMRPMAQILATDEQVNDVTAYISTL
jgi:cytochrome c oxidase subunit 2